MAEGDSGYTSVPVPDPTVLTTAALYREVGVLKELIETRIDEMQRQIDCRLDDMETLRDAKLAGIDKRFDLLNELREQGRDATQRAVSAALQTQKEAAEKAELNMTKQLEALRLTTDTQIEAVRRSIDINKERVGEVAQIASGYGQQRQGAMDSRAVIGWGIAAIASLVAIGAVVLTALKP